MSELPKLKICFHTKGIASTCDIICDYCIKSENYKSQIAFYEKYKDNFLIFKLDYPEVYKDYYDNYAWKSNVQYRDWLFNKLFKEGIL